MSTPIAIVSEACGSRSIANTERPCSLRAAATLRVLVVLAVPPFWLKNATIRVIRRATEDVRTSKRIAQHGAKLARERQRLGENWTGSETSQARERPCFLGKLPLEWPQFDPGIQHRSERPPEQGFPARVIIRISQTGQ